jgi:hypothetical protein
MKERTLAEIPTMIDKCLNNEAMRIANGWAFAAYASEMVGRKAASSQRMKSFNLSPTLAPDDHIARLPVSISH